MHKYFIFSIILSLVCLIEVAAQPSLSITSTAESVNCGEIVEFSILVSNYENISDMQFDIVWDALDFQYVGKSEPAPSGAFILEISDPTASADTTGLTVILIGNPTNLVNGDALLATFQLQATNTNGNPNPVEVDASSVIINGSLINEVTLTNNTISIGVPCNATVTPSISCPFQSSFTIGMGQDSAVIQDIAAVINNNDGNVSLQYTIVFPNGTTISGVGNASGLTFPLGTSQITYSLVSASNPTNIVTSCATSVTIIEEQPAATSGFSITGGTIDCGASTQTCVGVRSSAIDDLANIQFSISWDPAILQYVQRQNVSTTITGGFPMFTEFIPEGILNFAWADLSTVGQDFGTDELLFELCFNPVANGNGDLVFMNASDETPLVVSQVDATASSGQLDISGELGFTSVGLTVVNCMDEDPVFGIDGFTITGATIDCGVVGQTCFPVRTSPIDDLANIQFSITWDPAILQYVQRQNVSTKITGGFFDFEEFISEGVLNFAWADLSTVGQDFGANELLFELCFDPVANGNGNLIFMNASDETPLVVSQIDVTDPSGQQDISGDLSFAGGLVDVVNCTDMPPNTANGFNIAGATIDCGAEGQTCVGVRTSAVDDLANLQFSITWDPSIIEYVRRQNESTKIIGGFFDFEAFTAEGILNFAWADLSLAGQDFDDDELLFELCFNPIANGDGNLIFMNASDETPLVVSQVDATSPSGQRDISGDFDFTSTGIIVENCIDMPPSMDGFTTVSYTHLTLPTICSV